MTRILGHDAEWFRRQLRSANKSQADLSRIMGKDKGTISNMIAGKRPVQLAEIEALAEFLECSTSDVLNAAGVKVSTEVWDPDSAHETISEIAVRGGKNGDGFSAPGLRAYGDEESVLKADVRETWGIPGEYAKNELGVSAQSVRIIEIQGDSMEPTLCAGDRVMIDTAQRVPSPPGIFAIWDGFGIVVKRIEQLLDTAPPSLLVASDNPLHKDVAASLTDINIVGRVVWMARKF